MPMELEPSLQRWIEARLIDATQAERIRAFETARAPERRARWPVVVALAFGGMTLAAGVLLFVSAHWDELSPFQRMALLVLAVGGFHAAGAFCLERFRALGMTLHAAGTVSLGGAIALAGQIFHMQEHWPTAALLWAAGAVAGWLLLGDWPQLALTAVLVPAWLITEWIVAAEGMPGAIRVADAGVLLLAICYLSAPASASLEWIGGLALLPAALVVALDHHLWRHSTSYFDSTLATGWAGAILIPLAIAYVLRRAAAWMNLVAALWVIGLSWLAFMNFELALYAWCAIGSAALVGWGIHELRAERINLGMAAFALTLIFFFFSSVMDRLGRSASLISLGMLFLAGGWQWEKLRRRLVTRVRSGGAP